MKWEFMKVNMPRDHKYDSLCASSSLTKAGADANYSNDYEYLALRM